MCIIYLCFVLVDPNKRKSLKKHRHATAPLSAVSAPPSAVSAPPVRSVHPQCGQCTPQCGQCG